MKYFRKFTAKGFFLSVLACQMVVNCLSAASNGWEYGISPYGWFADQKGTALTLPGMSPTEVDVEFGDDILGNINFAAMVMLEARKDDWGFFADLAYLDLRGSQPTPETGFSSAHAELKLFWVSLAAEYRLVETPNITLDLMAGGRFWSLDTDIELRAGEMPETILRHKETWIDPMVGLKGRLPFPDSKFFLDGAALIGGFGVGADSLWEINANIGYQWTPTFSTTLGYRYMDLDYDEEDFVYDVVTDGFMLGLAWQW